jgi:PhoH-like ATPase
MKNNKYSNSPRHNVKNYIIDTNVLLHDPNSLFSFQENNVILPIEVIEEIDRFKREPNDLGQNARMVSRILDQLRANGRLSEGVTLPNGGLLRIVLPPKNIKNLALLHNHQSTDSRILILALATQKSDPKTQTILVTKDINLRIKADAIGIVAEDYETDRVLLQDLYTGMFELKTSPQLIDQFKTQERLPLPPGRIYYPNEYCILIDESQSRRPALAKVDATAKMLIPIVDSRDGVWGVKPKNREQYFAFDALLDENIKLATIMGKAGTGKTLLTLAAALKCTIEDRQYRRVVVARPTIAMGKELGFLPGTLEEKLNPWMQPIYDALELLGDLNMTYERRTSELIRSGSIVVEALSYIRGRSIANQYIVIDEAQNLTPLEVKTIITRVGQGSKIVFTGDPYQIDNPYVDSSSNGFNYIVSKFRQEPIAAHIELLKGERSELAELAANLL